MSYPADTYERFEHAGVIVQIVQDIDGMADPQDNDNAGTIYSWTRDFDGDERISEPDWTIDCPKCKGEGTIDGSDEPTAPRYDRRTCPVCKGDGEIEASVAEYFAYQFDAALTIPLFFSDYGSSGARIYESDDPNCAICFTQKEIDYEWSGHIDPYPVTRDSGEVVEYGGARRYAKARINELDEWLQGYVFGIVIRERNPEIKDPDDDDSGEVLESVWGFIGDPTGESGKYIYDEARDMAEGCAEQIEREKAEALRWACRDHGADRIGPSTPRNAMTSLHEWRQAADESLRRSRERRTEKKRRSLAPLVIALAILAALIATLALNSVQHL